LVEQNSGCSLGFGLSQGQQRVGRDWVVHLAVNPTRGGHLDAALVSQHFANGRNRRVSPVTVYFGFVRSQDPDNDIFWRTIRRSKATVNRAAGFV